MTTIEWSQFIGTIGFCGFAAVSALACYRIIVSGGIMYRQQAIFCFGMFVTMFALISAIGQLNRPPFNWLSIDHVSISTAVVIWMIFIVTVVGVTRRAD